jgi:glutamate/tyrosine decarboxylase-like PLP-dependent enzyme
MKFPQLGTPRDELRSRLQDAISRDADWRGGKIWSLVYFAGDDVAEVLKEAYTEAIYSNGLGPGAFKSLKKFESEVIAMTGDLLSHPEGAGNMTSGGTESILMAVSPRTQSRRTACSAPDRRPADRPSCLRQVRALPGRRYVHTSSAMIYGGC